LQNVAKDWSASRPGSQRAAAQSGVGQFQAFLNIGGAADRDRPRSARAKIVSVKIYASLNKKTGHPCGCPVVCKGQNPDGL
jgi:hypothetical protein